ncbi:MAG: M17 family peptidase N-terminal domain-containing protein, partial [Desulfuromonadaceae bacterium]
MEIKITSGSPLGKKSPCTILGVFEGKLRTPLLKELDKHLEGALSKAVRDQEFNGKHMETLLFYSSGTAPERILLVGLGKEKGAAHAGTERLRQALGTAAQFLQKRRLSS